MVASGERRGTPSGTVTSRPWMTTWLRAPCQPPPGGVQCCITSERKLATSSLAGSSASRAAISFDRRPKSKSQRRSSAMNSSSE